MIGALKGDTRSMFALFRLAEQTGQFEEAPVQYNIIERVIVDPSLTLLTSCLPTATQQG